MSRECPEPPKSNRGGRSGFNSGAGDRNTGFRSSDNNGGNTFRNLRNQNDNDRGDSSESKPTFTGWRGGAANTNSNNDSDEAGKRTFGSSTTRGGFTNSGGGFRGNQGSN
jgi:hypothetical protein